MLFHVTVLFTPMITVILSGEYPGAPRGIAEPLSISTRMPLVLDELLLLLLMVDEPSATGKDEVVALDMDAEEPCVEDAKPPVALGGCVAA